MTLERMKFAPLWVAVFLISAPFLILPVRAIADEWRSPALIPQRFGTRALSAVRDDALIVEALSNSIIVGLGTMIVGLILAWPAARSLCSPGTPALLTTTVLAPVLLPPLVVGEGLRVWFLRIGIADGLIGIGLSHLISVVPYMILVLLPGFTGALSRREEAARVLGASRFRVWLDVTTRILAGRVGVALVLGFTISWSQYGSSLGVGGGIPMLPLVLVPFVRSDPQIAAVLDLIFLLPPFLLFATALRAGVDRTA